jgi:hypothetical protein
VKIEAEHSQLFELQERTLQAVHAYERLLGLVDMRWKEDGDDWELVGDMVAK